LKRKWAVALLFQPHLPQYSPQTKLQKQKPRRFRQGFNSFSFAPSAPEGSNPVIKVGILPLIPWNERNVRNPLILVSDLASRRVRECERITHNLPEQILYAIKKSCTDSEIIFPLQVRTI